MRPVVRGPRPQNAEGEEIEFKEYPQARATLIARMGEFCSYCEMHLDASLAVEHVQPKKPPGATAIDQARALDWGNFLLACPNCNSTKTNAEVDLNEYLWPDRDNTFRAMAYSEGGVVSAALAGPLKAKAENTIKLMGLDKQPLNDPKASDRRWQNRRETWDIAKVAKERLQRCDCEDMREQIKDTAKGQGFWSIWMTVFSDDPDMVRRFIHAFPGTAVSCFDNTAGYAAVARAEGRC
jgi:uncharacterized protein (TIGR02646 family)